MRRYSKLNFSANTGKKRGCYINEIYDIIKVKIKKKRIVNVGKDKTMFNRLYEHYEYEHELLLHENSVICNAKNKVDIIHWN